ncbi:MAG: hypothetical protein M5U19_01245 [Microthrixaceae bacterium]|nr:hypothetical protein [Microthrixaceae bacterium]
MAEEGGWDLVVVDTPPTRHALDFLDAPQRLANFLDHRLYRILMTPTKGIVRAVNVAAQGVMRSLSKVVGGEVIADAIAFFAAFEGMEQGFKERASAVDRLLGSTDTSFVLVASPKADTVAEAGYFAKQLGEHGISVRALVVNRMQPRFDRTPTRRFARERPGGLLKLAPARRLSPERRWQTTTPPSRMRWRWPMARSRTSPD